MSSIKRTIEETDSSLTLRDEEDSDLKLTVLKKPIALGSLISENEDSPKINKKTHIPKAKKFSNDLRHLNIKNTAMKTMTLLKEPISLDRVDLRDNSSVTINVKTVEGSVYRRSRNTKEPEKPQSWMTNAATIFEFTYIYPFIFTNSQYKCFVCLEPFHDPKDLKQHTMNHDHKEIRQRIYKTAADTVLKVDVTHLQCQVCKKTLQSIQELKSHLISHGKVIDSDTQDNLIPFRLGYEPFKCQICGEEYLKLTLLVIHMSKHFNNFSCEVCGSVFVSRRSMSRHLETHESGTFPCDKCDKVFKNSTKKKLHMRGVHILKHFHRRCPLCPERFNSDYMRTKHLRIVHNKSTVLNRCGICGKEYHLKYQLQLHIRSVHNQEKNQECSVCHSRFFSKFLLGRHMVIHTGIKNYKCEVCGKAYVRKAHLTQHSKSHIVA